ncbi:MAG: PAS domain-containing protein, partial [Armatimonadota bacterium]
MQNMTLAALAALAAVFAATVSRHAPAARPTFGSLSIALAVAGLSFVLRLAPDGVADAQEMITAFAALPFLLYAVVRYRTASAAEEGRPFDPPLVRFAASVLGGALVAALLAGLLPADQRFVVGAALRRVQGIVWVGACLCGVGLLIGVRKSVEDEVLDIPAFQLTFLLIAVVIALDEKLVARTRPDQLADLMTNMAAAAALWLLFSSLSMSFRAAAARRRRLEEENARLYAESRNRAEHLRAITCCAPMAIVAANRHGRLTEINEAAERMCATKRSDKLGTPLVDCFPDDVRQQVKDMLREVLAGKSVRDHDTHILDARGRLVPVRLYVSPLKDDRDEPVGVVAVAVDLREQKRLQAQLVQSEKLAAIGELASGVAHEFNNALAVMTLAAQRAQLSPSRAVVRRSLDMIIEACRRSGETT